MNALIIKINDTLIINNTSVSIKFNHVHSQKDENEIIEKLLGSSEYMRNLSMFHMECEFPTTVAFEEGHGYMAMFETRRGPVYKYFTYGSSLDAIFENVKKREKDDKYVKSLEDFYNSHK